MNRWLSGALMGTLLFTLVGCDTEEAIGSGDLRLSDEVENPLNIHLVGDQGSLSLSFIHVALSDVSVEELAELLEDGTVGITVYNDESGINYKITDGTSVDTTATEEGQYKVTASLDGTRVDVVFFNGFKGSSLTVGGKYTATISILTNSHVKAEDFSRDVVVWDQE